MVVETCFYSKSIVIEKFVYCVLTVVLFVLRKCAIKKV